MLNPFRRSFMLPGKLGACLVTGTEKIRCGYGNGDCLLLDLRHRIFAVADASERFPQASRLLLEGLAATVCQKGPPEDENEFNSLLSQVWSNQQFIHKTTLSCVVLLENGAGPTAMVSNNGDSSVTILASDSGAVRYRTVADMNFAGRSTRPNPAVTHSLKGTPTAIVLATDGITDLGKIPLNGLSDPPHRIGDRIAGRLHRGKGQEGNRRYWCRRPHAGHHERCHGRHHHGGNPARRGNDLRPTQWLENGGGSLGHDHGLETLPRTAGDGRNTDQATRTLLTGPAHLTGKAIEIPRAGSIPPRASTPILAQTRNTLA